MSAASLVTIGFAIVLCLQKLCNVHAYTTRSYDLDVPGSQPIRIIEADPEWNLNNRKANNRGEKDRSNWVPQSLDSIKANYEPFTHRDDNEDRFKYKSEFEHRTLKPSVISNRNDGVSSDSLEEENKPEKLKEFLNSYASNLKKLNIQVDNSGVKQTDDQLTLDDKFVDIPDDQDVTTTDKPEKSKSWNLLHFDKIQDGPQDNRGWVSMEAVPWSVSKISKWQEKPKKNKYQNSNSYYDQSSRPSNNDRFHNNQPEFLRPNYPKPIKPNGVIVGQRPNSYFDESLEEDNVEDEPVNDYFNRRPSFPRPSATYGHKVNLHTVQTYNNGNSNKRPFNDNCKNHNHHSNHHNGGHSFQNSSPDDGIITDGLPANFPEHEYGNRRRGVTDQSTADATHPFKGEGEWVLLSTTKGYKYPPNPRQRSLRFTDTVSDGSDNALQMNTHKSVRLTVLPPLNDGRVKMTTSHGGLLQVDATFQTVEESQKQHAKKQKSKQKTQRRPIRVKPQMETLKSQPVVRPARKKIPYQIQTADSAVAASESGSSMSDSSAVLAAVGAGMIPAGMALLVPIAMNGKRRRRHVDYPQLLGVRSDTNGMKLTLPSTL